MWKNSLHGFLSLVTLVVVVATNPSATTTFGFVVPTTTKAKACYQRRQPGESSRNNNSVGPCPFCAASASASLITFDLDDTLFPIGPVVADANQALFRHMKSYRCDNNNDDNDCRNQEEYSKTAKQLRNELQNDKTVITYTELRKRTIRRMLETRSLPNTTSIPDAVVNSCYQLWEDHRHLAAEAHLYPGVLEMLTQLRNHHPDAVLAAITNGKGDPTQMKSLVDFFEFTISGEDNHVFPSRKPSAGIYEACLEQYRAMVMDDIKTRSDGTPSDNDNDNKASSFCWIHIGDDLANDVGGSARCGAKAIWLDLDGHDDNDKTNGQQQQPVWSTATPEELELRRLLDEEAKQYVSKRVTTLESIPSAVDEIITQSLAVVSFGTNDQKDSSVAPLPIPPVSIE